MPFADVIEPRVIVVGLPKKVSERTEEGFDGSFFDSLYYEYWRDVFGIAQTQ